MPLSGRPKAGWPRSGLRHTPTLSLGHQRPAAFLRDAQRVVVAGLAVQPKQAKDRACAPAEDVELPVRRNDLVGDQLRGDTSVVEDRVVFQ